MGGISYDHKQTTALAYETAADLGRSPLPRPGFVRLKIKHTRATSHKPQATKKKKQKEKNKYQNKI